MNSLTLQEKVQAAIEENERFKRAKQSISARADATTLKRHQRVKASKARRATL